MACNAAAPVWAHKSLLGSGSGPSRLGRERSFFTGSSHVIIQDTSRPAHGPPAVAAPRAARRGGEEERKKGIFEFVTDNPSSKGGIYLDQTPEESGNVGQMVARIQDMGRDNGRYVQAGGFRYFVRELKAKGLFGLGGAGRDAPKVLLLHGAPTQSWCFRAVMEQLSEKGYDCYAPDWLGFGFSDKPQPGYDFAYTEEAFHGQLDQLLEALGLQKQKLCLVVQGFILGSYGLTWALKHPERLAKLAILNTPLTPGAPLPGVFGQLRLPFVGEFVAQNAILAERFIEKGSPYVLESDDADIYRLPYLDTSDAGFALLETLRKAPLKDLQERVKSGFAAGRWSVPTVVAWGVKDRYLKESEAKEFEASNPSVIRAEILEGAGHLPQEDWPEKVVDTLLSHLKRG